jgi:hypothetical protein
MRRPMVIAMATTKLQMSVVLDSWDTPSRILEIDSRLVSRALAIQPLKTSPGKSPKV